MRGISLLQRCIAWAGTPRCIYSEAGLTGPVAFAFDIDGVLVKGGTVLAGARKAMQLLCSGSGSTFAHPACFLTNSGGYTEQRKAEQLTGWLGVPVHARQVRHCCSLARLLQRVHLTQWGVRQGRWCCRTAPSSPWLSGWGLALCSSAAATRRLQWQKRMGTSDWRAEAASKPH